MAESDLFRHWVGLLVLTAVAFLAGLWATAFINRAPAREKHSLANVARGVVPEPSGLLTTFQGILRRKDDARDYWATAQITRIGVTRQGVYGFDYILVMHDAIERGEGILFTNDGSVQMGMLRGEVRLLPNGTIEMGSQFDNGPPVWRFTSSLKEAQ